MPIDSGRILHKKVEEIRRMRRGAFWVQGDQLRLFRFMHSLKNHLATMKIISALLISGLRGTQHERYAALLCKELADTENLLTSLSYSPSPQVIAVNDLLSEIVDRISLQAASLGVAIVINVDQEPMRIFGNPLMISEALRNVLDNALEALQPGGTLTVSAHKENCSRDEDGRLVCEPVVRISITDTGPGIPEHVLKKLPTPFFTTKPNGMGLGLVIAQAAALAHGGTMNIESGSWGTCVTFVLPCRHQASHQ